MLLLKHIYLCLLFVYFQALKMKEGAQNRRFYCKVCGESFEFSALLKHHEKIHEKENNFYCKYCKKVREREFLNINILF